MIDWFAQIGTASFGLIMTIIGLVIVSIIAINALRLIPWFLCLYAERCDAQEKARDVYLKTLEKRPIFNWLEVRRSITRLGAVAIAGAVFLVVLTSIKMG